MSTSCDGDFRRYDREGEMMENGRTTMSVLVAVEDYPGSASGKTITHKFVHVRNLYYQSLGIDVTVLNFSETGQYVFEGIKVIGPREYRSQSGSYDLLLCHQPNLKHHLRFCLRYLKDFHRAIFFFHGHEVLRMSESYPKPYPYQKTNPMKSAMRDVYDTVKFHAWRLYFSHIKERASFVFVSQWMYDEFMKWLNVDKSFLGDRAYVIPNCIGAEFEANRYQPSSCPEYDLITIRGNLDTSKYALDLVVKSALSNPGLKYLVVGKGDFFKYVPKPHNITWLDTTFSHEEIVSALNRSRCALMPTRVDAQGLMMCEIASFGIPLITSDIPVCHEVLAGFPNVRFVQNEAFDCELADLLKGIAPRLEGGSVFSKDNTIGKEVGLMQRMMREGV